jgi:uncharacterized membrane protein (UPF0127 family)
MTKLNKFFFTAFFALLFSSNSFANSEKEYICSLPTVKFSIKSQQLNIRTACTIEQLIKGLMDVRELPQNSGMIFAFNNSSILKFWAKDTYIPLDIAYLNNKLQIVDIKTLKPLDRTTVSSTSPSMYALEVNAGWFKNNNINVGDRLEIIK